MDLVVAAAAVHAAAEAAAMEAATSTYCAVEATAGFETVAVGAMEIGEAMIVAIVAAVSAVEEGRTVDGKWRVEAPAKWAIEDPITRDEGVGAVPRTPIPARAIPAGAAIHVEASRFRVGFG